MCEEIDGIQLNFASDKLFLLNLLLAFLMFGIALSLKVADFKRIVETPRKAFAGLISQYIFLPLLTYALVLIFTPCPSIALGMFLLGSCPGGNMSNFLSHLAKGNVALSVTLTATQTILAPLMTPLTFAICANIYGPTRELMQSINIDTVHLIIEILTILGIPLILGMFINYKFPGFTAKIIKPIQKISIFLFLGFVVFLFVSNYDQFVQIIGAIFILVLLHNGLAMVGGYSIASLFRLDFKDKKCLAIETGIHNATLGLIVWANFFPMLGGVAVVAGWWGIWDLVTGFAVAITWSRMAKKKPRITG
jgi:BASS family bile acid:Na+ symporter